MPPPPPPEQQPRTIRHFGRVYRVSADQGPADPDPRRYLHLVAVGPEPVGG